MAFLTLTTISIMDQKKSAPLPSLKADLFGHLHRNHEVTTRDTTIFSNGAIMNSDCPNINSPNLIEI